MFADLAQLEELLSRPSPAVLDVLSRHEGDLLILGAGGKMGPTLARMVRRADEMNGLSRRVIAVSRFSDTALVDRLTSWGVEVLRRDLLEEHSCDQLPEAPNVLFMTGMKFGGSRQPGLMWAMNTELPARVCRRFCHSRLVAFSTGNVYPLVRPETEGSQESDPLSPVGEYGMSALGRERIFQHFSEALQIPVALACLNYAVELRYGVLVDIARSVWEGRAVDVSMGYVNVIWQGDANAWTLCAFDEADVPAVRCNIAGPELLQVRQLAEEFGRLLERPVTIVGAEKETALLNNGRRMQEKYGPLRCPVSELLPAIADWIRRGMPLLDKPTHFQSTDGVF